MTSDRQLANRALKCPQFRLKGGWKLAMDLRLARDQGDPKTVREVFEAASEGESLRTRIKLLWYAERKECDVVRVAEVAR